MAEIRLRCNAASYMHEGAVMREIQKHKTGGLGAQVYVFCCAHAEQVKQHLESTGWTHDGASMDVQVCNTT